MDNGLGSARAWRVQQLRTRRRRNPEVWLKANRLVVGLILLALVAFVVMAFHPELVRYNELALRLDREKGKLQAQELENARLKREQQLLQNDPEYVETIARDALGVMKPGEEIIRLDAHDSQKPSAVQASAP
ncbi:MAG: FtsB family cell division protein [Verrucomicrobiota bacterium]